jgi:hypothetical protein
MWDLGKSDACDKKIGHRKKRSTFKRETDDTEVPK